MTDHTANIIAEGVRFLKAANLAAAEGVAAGLLMRSEDPDALHLLALVRLRQNRTEDAAALLERSLAVRPNHPSVLINLGKARKSLGRGAEAASAFNAALSVQPNLAAALYELGEIQHQAGDGAQAEISFRRLLALAPSHLQARFWLGAILRNTGRAGEAEKLLSEGLIQARQTGMYPAFVYNLAFAQYQQGKRQEALDNFTLAARLDPQLQADPNCADILEEVHRFDDAMALLEQVLAREPGNVLAHTAYNNLLHRLGRDREFLASYDRAPRSPPLLTGKASLLHKKGRQAEAHELYAAVLKSEPHNLEAAVGAAAALNALHRPGDAVALLEQALKYNPQNAALYRDLAGAALQLGDPQKAAAMAEQSLRLAPLDQASLAVMGTAWRMMGDARDEALNGYDDLIQIFDLETPEGFSSMEDFNAELGAWLSGLHADVREPLDQSLRGGSQTRGYIFGQGHFLAEKLKVRIDEAITHFLTTIKPDSRHPFRGRYGHGFRFRDSWSSRLRDCGFHANHIHAGGWISSCYYVALPEAVQDCHAKQGWIKFGEPSFDVGLSMRRAIQPRVGRLVLFPSYVWHGTIPFRESTTRTTIAFDAVPN